MTSQPAVRLSQGIEELGETLPEFLTHADLARLVRLAPKVLYRHERPPSRAPQLGEDFNINLGPLIIRPAVVTSRMDLPGGNVEIQARLLTQDEIDRRQTT